MMNSKGSSGSKKMKEKVCSKLMRRVKGLKKKAEELSILCGAEISVMITDSSSSSTASSSQSSSSSRFCYSWPESLETCTSSVQRYVNFNHQKEMMISQKKRKFDCLNRTDSSIDKKLKKPMSDSSLATDFCHGFDDDLQCLFSMMDSREKSIEEKIKLMTENQPKEGEAMEQHQVLGSDHWAETANFEGLEIIAEMGNSVSSDLCFGLDEWFHLLSSEGDCDSPQIELLDEAHEVEQSDGILGCQGNNSDDLERISVEFIDDKLQHLLPQVDSAQIQLFSDEPEQVHDQVEILGHCEESEVISEYQNFNGMKYVNLIGNFEQEFEAMPKTSDDYYLMQGSCYFSGATNQTLNDSWQNLLGVV